MPTNISPAGSICRWPCKLTTFGKIELTLAASTVCLNAVSKTSHCESAGGSDDDPFWTAHGIRCDADQLPTILQRLSPQCMDTISFELIASERDLVPSVFQSSLPAPILTQSRPPALKFPTLLKSSDGNFTLNVHQPPQKEITRPSACVFPI